MYKEPWTNDTTRYLGDGVYASTDGFGVVLRMNDHRNSTSEIYLEPHVIAELNDYIKRLQEEGNENL